MHYDCRVEMTLKDSQEGSWTDLGQLKKGDVVKGKVKRLEAFGAFVDLHNSALTGLAHISEVSDDYIKNVQDILQVGQGMLQCEPLLSKQHTAFCDTHR